MALFSLPELVTGKAKPVDGRSTPARYRPTSAAPDRATIVVCLVTSKLSPESGRTLTGAGTTELIRLMCCSGAAATAAGAALTSAAVVAATVSPASNGRRAEWGCFRGTDRVEPEWQGSNKQV